MTAPAYVVIFRSTRNALLRPGRRNWQDRADMCSRVQHDGVTGVTADAAEWAADQFRPGSSRLAVVPFTEWLAEMGGAR